MSARGFDAVVVDTNVYAAVLGTDPHAIAAKYEPHLTGRRLVISFQTVAEIRYGAFVRGWSGSRKQRLEERIAKAAVIPPHDQLSTEWAALRNDCRKAGHGLQEKAHAADLWIGATARLLDVPLVTHDRVFENAPGLVVICEA
jgi:hypothetical protein